MKILFKVFPQKSHLNATFPFARVLRDQGHEIVYAGVEPLRSHVEAQEIAYHGQSEDFFPYQESKSGGPKVTVWLLVKMWWKLRERTRVLRQKAMRGDAFDDLVHAVRPDYVLVDSPYTFYAFSLYKHKIPFGTLESMMNLNQAPGCPPFDTSFVPTGGKIGQLICSLYWRRYFLKRSVGGALNLRLDWKRQFVLEAARRSEVQPNFISFDRYSHLGLKNVPEFILTPRVLDFPRKSEDNQIYIGLSVDMGRVESSSDYRFNTRFSALVKSRQGGRPIVYCSLGTAAWRYDGAESFLRRVVASARGASWNLILTTGTEFDLSRFGAESENVAVFQVVPQLQVLKHADLMITHGGMNSITECVLSGVPMLVYPGTHKIDQPGNAARVVYHGLGLKGNLKKESALELARKISGVLGAPDYKRRVNEMKARIEAETSWAAVSSEFQFPHSSERKSNSIRPTPRRAFLDRGGRAEDSMEGRAAWLPIQRP